MLERRKMALLEMRDALFVRAGRTLAGPVNLTVREGERCTAAFRDAREASIVALMAAGIVKTTSGNVFVGAFDPHIQPVQVKRLVGYVSHEASAPLAGFERYVEYRAALWGIPRQMALARAADLRRHLEDVEECFATPLIAALLSSPRLLVLDRPPEIYASRIEPLAPRCAILSTHEAVREAVA